MTLPTVVEAPLPQTIRAVERLLGLALVWEPARWVRDVPAPPDYRIPQDADDAGWGA